MNVLPVTIPKDIDKYFFNRKKDMQKINSYLEMLKLDIPNQILVTGFRGVGKTMLLRKILKDQDNKFLSVSVDLSEIYGRNQGDIDEEEVIKELLNSINDAVIDNKYCNVKNNFKTKIINELNNLKLKDFTLNKESPLIKDIPLPVFKNNYSKLSKFVMELPQKIVDSVDEIEGFIIVLDEFQLLKGLNNPNAFFWLIRSYTQKQYNVSYVFTGSVSNRSEIVDMINGPDGAFGGRMIQVNIDPFTKEETMEYLNTKSNNIKFTDEGFERFYKCTRGIPSYINSLASLLPNNMESDEKIIKEVIVNNVDQIAILWVLAWGNLSKIEKQIIVKIIDSGNSVNWNILDNEMEYSHTTLSKYIQLLINKGIVDYKTDHYYISDHMLKLWVKTKYEKNYTYPL